MFLSSFSVRRPVALSCLLIGLSLLGINAYRKMGLELMPKVDVPYITIVTVYPGATPEEIETDIAKPIEDEMVAISGLKHVTSSCFDNVCQTLLEFNLEVDVDIAATDVREKLDLIKNDFPEGVEDPKVVKFDVNAKPIITLALTGDVPIEELYDYADNTLRDRLTVLSGVADVTLVGGAEREVHVRLDREKLAGRGLTSLNVVQAIKQGVRTIPSGRVRENGTEYSVKFDADYRDVGRIGEMQIANTQGQRCYIKDVADVGMATGEVRQVAAIDGKPAIAIRVVKKSEANAVKVVGTVQQAVAAISGDLPGGMQLVWVTDDGTFTQAAISSAWSDVLQGILLTALILLLFLHNLRSTLVVAVTMPMTILIGLFFMRACNYTLNIPTLLAIGLSVGILVTNSIVVLEAIVRRLDEGLSPRDAALLGSRESFIPVLASAGTNAVVLFPLAAMQSIIGRFIAPFAITMVLVTLVSLFISFTLTPMMCAMMLKPKNAGARSPAGWFIRYWDKSFDGVVGAYRRALQFNERHRVVAVLVLAAVVAMFVQSIMMGRNFGTSLGGNPDRGEVYVKVEFPTRYDLSTTLSRMGEIESSVKDLPHLRHMLTTVGKVEGMLGKTSEGVYLAQILLRFNERSERPESISELVDATRQRVGVFSDCIASVNVPHFSGGQEAPIQLQIFGYDLNELDSLATQISGMTSNMPGFQDVDTTVREGKPELRVRPNRPVLADLGVAATDLGLALRGNLEGITAGTFKREGRNYDIVVKYAEREGKSQVRDFLLPAAPGMPVSLAAVGSIEEGRAPVLIPRRDKWRVSKVFANLAESLPLGAATNQLSAMIEEKGLLPPGYSYSYAGEYEIMAEAQSAMAEAGIIAVILVVLSLAAILESFKQPVIILVTLPLAIIGVFWSLYVSGESMSIFVMMSIVMLIGIVVNNAILIIDKFNVLTAGGLSRHTAMIQASCDQFRPIAMITIAAVLGMMPLALSRGIGAEMRNGVGLASAAGILVSGILTMVTIPILYDLFTRGRKKAETKTDT
ncbi:MAG: efflux RND transporter permease subunit [Candidatus Hydrogenedentes bacterium]|nr:efflux RND transporter permease subunit [Candidatus Hydrogenedentota bacterium]